MNRRDPNCDPGQRLVQSSAWAERTLVPGWEELKGQVVLGGQKFVQNLRRHLLGDAREQRAAKTPSRVAPGFYIGD